MTLLKFRWEWDKLNIIEVTNQHLKNIQFALLPLDRRQYWKLINVVNRSSNSNSLPPLLYNKDNSSGCYYEGRIAPPSELIDAAISWIHSELYYWFLVTETILLGCRLHIARRIVAAIIICSWPLISSFFSQRNSRWQAMTTSKLLLFSHSICRRSQSFIIILQTIDNFSYRTKNKNVNKSKYQQKQAERIATV